MFIRRVSTRPRANSKTPYCSFRLVRNLRRGDSVRQLTLLNLGAHFPVPEARWPELCELVRSLRHGVNLLFEPDPELLPLARQIADRLSRCALPDEHGNDLAKVHLDSLEQRDVRSVGGERLALHALDTLRFREALGELGVAARDARIAAALVLARMLQPSSERAAHSWLGERSACWELLGMGSGQPVSLNKLYRVGDLLWEQREQLERALFQRERNLFDLPAAIVFVDLTNVHYCGPARGQLRRGRSKQKRHDCPLVTLGLALDGSGFPARSEVLPGNVSEPSTLADALEALEPVYEQAQRPTVIMDAGLSTAATLAWLRERGYHWITVRRGGADPPEGEPDVSFHTRGGDPAHAWRLASAQEGESQLCLWSARRQAKDDAILARQRERFEQALTDLQAGLGKPGCTKRYDKVVERVGRLKERYSRVSQQYTLEVERAAPDAQAAPGKSAGKDSGGARKARRGAPLATAVRWQRNQQAERKDARAGTYVLRTSHTDWDLQRVTRTYWQLAEIEATFRSLKQEIGLRPIWHEREDRIQAHLFIAVLAYHAVHLLRRRLAEQGCHDSWTTIRNKLSNWVRLTSTLTTAEGDSIECRQDSRPDPAVAKLARAAGLEPGLNRVRSRTPLA